MTAAAADAAGAPPASPREHVLTALTAVLAIAWLGLAWHLMIADVWDELGMLSPRFRAPLGGVLAHVWTAERTYRPIPFTLIVLLMQAIGDNEMLWRVLRGINAALLLGALALLVAMLRRLRGPDPSRDLLLAAVFLFSGGAFIAAGWFANIFDASVLFFIALALWLAVGGRGIAAGLALGAACFCKENAVLGLPLVAFLAWTGDIDRRTALRIAAIALPCLAAYWTLRSFAVPANFYLHAARFSPGSVPESAAVTALTLWWQTSRLPHWLAGLGAFVAGLAVLRDYRAATCLLALVGLNGALHSHMMVPIRDLVDGVRAPFISAANFDARLFLVPAAFAAFLLAGWGRRFALAVVLVPVAWGAVVVYADHAAFQRAYAALYQRAAAAGPQPLRVHVDDPNIQMNRRGNLRLGHYPASPLRFDTATGWVVANLPIPKREFSLALGSIRTAVAATGGTIEWVRADGKTLRLRGWLSLGDGDPGQKLTAVLPVQPTHFKLTAEHRPDLWIPRSDPTRRHAGFQLDLEFASGDDARRAVASICLLAYSDSQAPALLQAPEGTCPEARP